MVLSKSFYIRWSAGRSPRVHEVNPGWDPSKYLLAKNISSITYQIHIFIKLYLRNFSYLFIIIF